MDKLDLKTENMKNKKKLIKSLFYMIHQDRTLYCIYSDYQLFIIKHIFIDTYRISLTEIVCLRIVYAKSSK